MAEAGTKSRGVLFVTTGAHYTWAAAQAALSVKASNPGLAIAIFTDQPAPQEPFDFVGAIPPGESRRKHEYLARTPFDETLYLDSDVRVTAPLDDLFRVLERFDMAGATVRHRTIARRQGKWRLDIPVAFPQINCGVLLYQRNERVWKFLGDWCEAIREGGFTRDQVPFREVLWLSGLRFHTLAPEYNIRNINLSPFPSKLPLPVILHIKALHSPSGLRRLAANLLLLPMRGRLRLGGHVF